MDRHDATDLLEVAAALEKPVMTREERLSIAKLIREIVEDKPLAVLVMTERAEPAPP